MSYVEWAALALLGLFLLMAVGRLLRSPLKLAVRVGIVACDICREFYNLYCKYNADSV